MARVPLNGGTRALVLLTHKKNTQKNYGKFMEIRESKYGLLTFITQNSITYIRIMSDKRH